MDWGRFDLASASQALSPLSGAEFLHGPARLSCGTGAKHLGAWWRTLRAVAAKPVDLRIVHIRSNDLEFLCLDDRRHFNLAV